MTKLTDDSNDGRSAIFVEASPRARKRSDLGLSGGVVTRVMIISVVITVVGTLLSLATTAGPACWLSHLHRIPVHQVQAGGFDTAIRHNPSMARPLRLVLSSIGVLLGLVALLLAAGQITLTYYLPSQSGIASTHTTTFAPGIAATSVAAVMLLITIGWLILAAVRAVRPWLFAIPVAALIVSYAVTIAVMGMPRPSF